MGLPCQFWVLFSARSSHSLRYRQRREPTPYLPANNRHRICQSISCTASACVCVCEISATTATCILWQIRYIPYQRLHCKYVCKLEQRWTLAWKYRVLRTESYTYQIYIGSNNTQHFQVKASLPLYQLVSEKPGYNSHFIIKIHPIV